MKIKYLLASLALVAGTAQANTISTIVNVTPSQSVQYVNFNVTSAGSFDITASDLSPFEADPYMILFSAPLNAGNFIESDDDSGSNDDAFIDRNLGLGSYILAVSESILSLSEALNGYNGSVNSSNDGRYEITIYSKHGEASFGNPSAVPVPAAAWLFGSALMGFVGFRRKSI